MSYVIQASPLSKIFQRRYQAECERDPDFFKAYYEGKGKPFEVVVPRTFGALTFTYNQPVHIDKVIPRIPGQKKDEWSPSNNDVILHWLTGGQLGDQSEETDIYGVVQLGVDLDISGAIGDVLGMSEAGAEKKAEKNFKDLQQELVERSKVALKKASELADWRVRRAMKITHHNLLKQFETMRSEGKGVYTPSVCEALGAHILNEELSKVDQARRAMLARFDKNMTTNLGA